MAPRKNKPKKSGAGSKRATKPIAKCSSAPAKRPAAKRQQTAEPERTAASERPRRTRKTAPLPVADGEDESGEGEDQPAPEQPARPIRRATRRKVSAATEPADAPAPSRRKRKANDVVEEDAEDVEQLRKRTRTGEAATSDQDDSEQAIIPASSRNDGRIDDAASNEELNLTDIDQLARAEINHVNFTVRDASDVTLRFWLQVYRDPAESACRLFYRLRFWLTRPGEAEQEAGHVHAYRISKPTTPHPQAEAQTWLRELLPNNLNDVHAGCRETALCLRAMFNLNGAPGRGKVRDDAIRQTLTDDSLIFIEMIHIRQRFQRQGLLTPLLQNWQLLLRQLPEWFAFAGNAVLVPGMPDSAAGSRAWVDANVDEAQVERTLTQTYQKQGFVVWARAVKVTDVLITVMGRAVPFIGPGVGGG